MKVIPFKIPKTQKDVYHFQIDRLNHFYDKLHQHPEVQITSIERSDGTLIAGDYIGDFASGDVFIVGSSLPHVFRNTSEYYLHERKEQAIGISLYIDTDVWVDNFWSMRDTMAIGHFFRSCYSAFRVKGKLKLMLQSDLKRMELLNGFERVLCMLNLLYKIYINKKDLQLISREGRWRMIKENDGIRMSDIIQFTMDESYRSISLKEVAEVANMTIEAFCRYFKMHTRKTYVSFLNEVRIQNACKLLSDTSLNKSDIAYQTGFSNLSYFNRTFKKVTGMTPGEYAKMLSE